MKIRYAIVTYNDGWVSDKAQLVQAGNGSDRGLDLTFLTATSGVFSVNTEDDNLKAIEWYTTEVDV